MSTYKCENPECGNVFRSNNPLSCPKCDTLEFSTIHIKSNKKFLVFGFLILLIGTGLFYLNNDESSNTESTTTLTLTESKIETIKFNGGLMYSTTNLNVRIKPNKNSEKVTSLKLNTPVLTNTKDIGGWVLIADTDSNKLGYVHSNYLSENITHISTTQKNKVVKPNNEEILSAEDYFDLAYENDSDYQYQIDNYTKCLSLEPDYAVAYYNRGHAKAKLGNYNAAITDYTRAIRIDPDYAYAYYNRGHAKAELGNYNAAITDYTSAIRIDPDYAATYSNRGLAKYNLGNYNAAITDYTSAIRIDPDYAYAYYNRGLAKYDLGNYNAAITDYTSAIRIDPDYAVAYYNRGIAKYNLGNYNAAITDWTSAIRIDPDYADVYTNRGIAKERLGLRYCSDYKKACDLGIERACEWYNEQCR